MLAPPMCGLQGFELFSNRRRLRRIRRDFHELLPEREPALDVLLHVEPDAPEAEIGDRGRIACVEVPGVEANRLLEPPQTILVSARLHVEAPDLGANGGRASVFARLRLESPALF